MLQVNLYLLELPLLQFLLEMQVFFRIHDVRAIFLEIEDNSNASLFDTNGF